MKNVISLLFILGTVRAHACIGASYKLNDDTILTGATIEMVSIKKSIIAERWLDQQLMAADKAGTVTHRVLVLGQMRDAGGVISTTYLVKSLESGEEKLYQLNTNYRGRGVRDHQVFFGDAPEPTPDKTFSSLLRQGC